MVGLILLYFVGKAFYDLADLNKKSRWLFAILGVLSYYVGLFIGGIIVALVYELLMNGSIDEVNDMVIGVLALPLGVLTCWGFYRILKSRWENKEVFDATTSEVLDANLLDQNSGKQ